MSAPPPTKPSGTIPRHHLAFAFNEWMRRYIADPSAFDAEFQTVAAFQQDDASGVIPSYGDNCVAMIDKLLGLGTQVVATDCTLSPTTADTMASTAQASASVNAITSGLPRPEADCPLSAEHHDCGCYWFRTETGSMVGYTAEQLTDPSHLSTLFRGDTTWLTRHFPAWRAVRRENGSHELKAHFNPVLAAAWLIRRCEEAGRAGE